MRNTIIAVSALVVTAAIVVGVLQARDGDGPAADPLRPLTRAEVSRPLPGTPPQLAALRRRVNELEPGGARALDAHLMALRGYPVVVNVWASWCHPCVTELPIFQRQALKHGTMVAFLGVNSGDNPYAARRLSARIPMPYPSIVDPRQAITGLYDAVGLPATAFYDGRGKRVVHQGPYTDEDQLSADIERYALGAAGP